MPDEKPRTQVALKTIKTRGDLEDYLKFIEKTGKFDVRTAASEISKTIAGFSGSQFERLVEFANLVYGKTVSEVGFIGAVGRFAGLSRQNQVVVPQMMDAVKIVNDKCINAASLEGLVNVWGKVGLDDVGRDAWMRYLSEIPGKRYTKKGNVEISYHDDNFSSFFRTSEKHFEHPSAEKLALLAVLPRYQVFYALDFLFSIVDNERNVNAYACAVNNCTKDTQQLLTNTRDDLKRRYRWDDVKMSVFDRLLYDEVVVAADVREREPECLKRELLKFCSSYTRHSDVGVLEFLKRSVPVVRRIGVNAGIETTRSAAEVLRTNDFVRGAGYLSLLEGICDGNDWALLGKDEFEKLVYVATVVYPAVDNGGVSYFNDIFSRVFELKDPARKKVIDSAARIVSGLRKKEVAAKVINDNVSAYFDRVLSDAGSSSGQLSAAIDGRVVPYMSVIASVMPKDVDADSWKRLIDVVGNKHQAMVDDHSPNRSSEMEAFVRDLLIRFGAMNPEQQRFFFEQLDFLKSELHWLRINCIAENLVPVAEHAYRSLNVKQAESFCVMMCDLSKYVKNTFLGKGELKIDPLEELSGKLEVVVGLPEQYRGVGISCARRVIDTASKTTNFQRDIREAVNEYFKVLSEKVGLLKHDFEDWVAFGAAQSKSVDDLVEYFTDKSGYFDDAHVTDAAAVKLDDVQEVLQRYVESLTGSSVVIQKSPKNELCCSMDGNKFVLPGVVKISRDVDKNFGVLKALASYQAGMVEAGTFVFDADKLDADLRKRFGDSSSIASFIASYDNPSLIRSLFELVEFERIDRFLREAYPGLKNDLDFFRRMRGLSFSPSNSGNDLQFFVDALYQKLMIGTNSMEIFNAMPKRVCGVVDNAWSVIVAEKDKSRDINRTLWVVDTLYTLAGCFLDVNTQVNVSSDTGVTVNLEKIAERGKPVACPIIVGPSDEAGVGVRFRYDEWDTSAKAYKRKFVQLFERSVPVVDGCAVKVFGRDADTVKRLRREFEALRPEERVVVKKQRSGDVDYDAVVKARAEMNAGISPSDKLYTKEFVSQRSVAAMVVSELSGSLKRFVDIRNPCEQLIDIVRKSELYFAEALDAIGDPFALAGYSGETAKRVEFYLLKDFGVPYTRSVRDAVASLRPLKQNRDGAGIRHATSLLSQRHEKTKVLIYLMEGVPQDFDYDGVHAVEDTKKAIIEAKREGCIPVVLAYGSKIDDRLRSVGQHAIYREVRNAKDLPLVLPDLYARITV